MICQSVSFRVAIQAPYPRRRYAPYVPAIDAEQVVERLRDLPGWELREGALRRAFSFPDFAAAMAFANRVADAAEAADHHPDMLVGWGRVELAWVSHSEGGVTERDLEMAARSDALAGPRDA